MELILVILVAILFIALMVAIDPSQLIKSQILWDKSLATNFQDLIYSRALVIVCVVWPQMCLAMLFISLNFCILELGWFDITTFYAFYFQSITNCLLLYLSHIIIGKYIL